MSFLSQSVNINGLKTNPNPLAVSRGDSQIANNLVLNRQGLVETRRGFDYHTTTDNTVLSLITYNSNLVIHQSDDSLWYDSALTGTLAQYAGTYANPTGATMRGQTARGNLYITTEDGPYRLESIAGIPVRSGIAYGLDVRAEASGTGGGFMGGSSQVSYRMLWRRTDGNNNVFRGAPSQREIFTNDSRVSASAITLGLVSASLNEGGTGYVVNDVLTLVGGTGTAATLLVTGVSGGTIASVQVYTAGSYSVVPTGTVATTGGTGGGAAFDITTGYVVATSEAHTFSDGDTVLISGADQSAYNGDKTITGISSTLFAIPVTGTPTSPATGTITAEKELDISVTFSVPREVTAGMEYEIYRTEVSGSSATDPGDDHYLVYRGTYSAGTEVSYTDSTLDSALVTPLYTNADEEGISQANWLPPYAKDIANYREYTFYANVKARPLLTLQLLSATGGLVDDTSSITIADSAGANGRTYTFSTSEDVATRKFKRYTAGTTSENIRDTAKSLCRVINQDATGHCYALYVSGIDEDPGILSLWGLTDDAGTFSVTADLSTTGDNFEPTIPTSGTTVAGEAETTKNRLFFSKLQQPESVPVLNYFDVGDNEKEIKRIIALKDSLFVIKEDGIHYLSGFSSNDFVVRELDTTTLILAADSAAKINNEICMLSNQGIVKFAESGVQVISYDIEKDISPLLAFSNLDSVTWGLGFERDRIYMLNVPTASNNTVAQVTYVYNVFRNQWTKWTKPLRYGTVVDNTREVYVSSGWEAAILKQRDTDSNADYSDEEVSVTINSVDNDAQTVNVTYSFAYVDIGQGFSLHKDGLIGKVVSVAEENDGTFTLTMRSKRTWTTGAATVRIPIYTHLRLQPDPCGQAGLMKTFIDYTWIIEQNTASALTLEVASNLRSAFNTVVKTTTDQSQWGSEPWGNFPWGTSQSTNRNTTIRENVPLGYTTGETLTIGIKHNVSQEKIALIYYSILFSQGGDITAV